MVDVRTDKTWTFVKSVREKEEACKATFRPGNLLAGYSGRSDLKSKIMTHKIRSLSIIQKIVLI
jgi:hypothetical protein